MQDQPTQDQKDHQFMLKHDPKNTPSVMDSDHDKYFQDVWEFETSKKIPYWTWVKEKFMNKKNKRS